MVPSEDGWSPNQLRVDPSQSVPKIETQDSTAMATVRDAASKSMWANRGTSRT